MTTHTDAKHNPDICPTCQKKAHQKAEDARYKEWKSEFESLGGRKGSSVGDCFTTINSFMNDLTPEQALRRQEREDDAAARKLTLWTAVVGLIVLVLIVRAFIV